MGCEGFGERGGVIHLCSSCAKTARQIDLEPACATEEKTVRYHDDYAIDNYGVASPVGVMACTAYLDAPLFVVTT